MLSLILAAGVAAAPAASPAPAAAAPVTPLDRYELTVNDETVATEETVRTVAAGTTTLKGRVSLKLPGGGDGSFRHEATLGPDGTPKSYTLEVDIPGQEVTLAVVPGESGYRMSVTPKGAQAPASTQTIAVKSPVVLMDNNLTSHIDAWTRTLQSLGPKEERTIQALVPQVAQAMPATVRRGDDTKGTLDGAPVPARAYRLTIANLTLDLLARASDGALLEASVPVQHLRMRRAGFVAPAPAAQSAAKAADPRETSTQVAGPAAKLPATLIVPRQPEPVAGIVLLSGSGPNDRDETIGPNTPFADIARGLADRGIATLRFDKRTHVVKDKVDATLAAEYYEDGAAAIAMLAGTTGVDPKRIFLLGHSEGAMVAPTLAASSPTIKGLVLMAPGVRPIDEMLIDQLSFGAKLMGRDKAEIDEQSKQLADQFALVKDPKAKTDPKILGVPATYWREVLALDVPAAVKKSALPVLVLQGDKDYQVRKDLDFERLRTSVGDTGGRVTFRSFADLNHLFIKIDGQSSGAEYGIPGKVDPAVINAIADWVLAR